MPIPIVLTVRKQSQRCPDKVLRPFYRKKNLLEICLEKIKEYSNRVYLAGFEPEFKAIANQFNAHFVQRTKESALSEDNPVIHSYLSEIPADVICNLNVCCPFIMASTVLRAIRTFEEATKARSLFSVKESRELIFNSERKKINRDHVFNSKTRRANYIGTNSFLIYNKNVLFNTGVNWTYELYDPLLFVVSAREGIDIDTEDEFIMAQALYGALQ